jgi:3-hydroxyisobutyrate dehydrogenase
LDWDGGDGFEHGRPSHGKGILGHRFNRTQEKAQRVIDRGAKWGATPKAVAEQSDVIFSIVGYPHDVRQVILGDEGALAGCARGS